MAGMYGVFHGPKGLTYIANKIQNLTATLNKGLATLNLKQQRNTEMVERKLFKTLLTYLMTIIL